MFERWSKYFGAVLALILVSCLALVVAAVGANFIQSLTVFIVKDADWSALNTVQSTFTVRTVMNFYYVLIGILFLGFFVLMEQMLVISGVVKELVLRRAAYTLGVELLILAFFQLAMLTYLPIFPLQVILGVIELILGIGLIYFSRRRRSLSRV